MLDGLIRESAPDLAPVISYGMLGYGPYRYRYESGREGDGVRIALASQKNYISLYVSCSNEKGDLTEQYKDRLPKANIGKCCVRFRRTGDVDIEEIRSLVKESLTAQLHEAK